MISPIVKYKNLIKVVKKAILAYFSDNSYALSLFYFPALGSIISNQTLFMIPDLNPSGGNECMATVYFSKSNPINCEGISVSNIKFGTSFVIDDTTIILRRVNKRLVFGIDISKNKVFTHNRYLYDVASYCVSDYVLPLYFKSENFVKAIKDLDSYLSNPANSTDSSAYNIIFKNLCQSVETYANYTSSYSACFDIDSSKLKQLFSIIDKTFGIVGYSSEEDLFDNVTQLIYDYQLIYKKHKYHFNMPESFSKLHEEILDCFNDTLSKYSICLSDEVIAMFKKSKVYINDTILPVAYLEDVSGLSGHRDKETKLSFLRVGSNGEFSFSNRFIQYSSTGSDYEKYPGDTDSSNRPTDIYDWVKKVIERSHILDYPLFKIKK